MANFNRAGHILDACTDDGFPKPGLYRVFVQFKRGDKVETAVFDTEVR